MNDDLESNAMRFDPKAYALAQERMKSAPIELTEQDFDQLAIVSKRLETDALEAKRLAQLALVQPAPAIVTKSAAPETIDEWVRKHGTKPITGAMLVEVFNVLTKGILAQKSRADTLEQANKDLQARVLELEAQRAIAHVDH